MAEDASANYLSRTRRNVADSHGTLIVTGAYPLTGGTCPLLKMGHGFVLAMLLEGVIQVDEEGRVTYADGLMDGPHKTYSPDLRKLTDEQKLERAASCAGITVDELQTLS